MLFIVYNPIPAPSNFFEKRIVHLNSHGIKKRVLKYNRHATAHRRGRVGTSAAAQVEETDVVVVGSGTPAAFVKSMRALMGDCLPTVGIGGLSAASMLAKYGVKVGYNKIGDLAQRCQMHELAGHCVREPQHPWRRSTCLGAGRLYIQNIQRMTPTYILTSCSSAGWLPL